MANAGAKSVGHPVDVASGVVTTSAVDVELPSGCGIRLARYYRSAPSKGGGAFGPGWRSEYDVTLREDLEGFTLVTAEGDAVTFDVADRREDDALVIDNPGACHALRRDGATIVVTQWGERGLERSLHFEARRDGAIALLRIEDTPGRFRELVYDAAGRVTAITESHGRRTLALDRDGEGRVVAASLVARGQRLPLVTYAYDDAGRLATATDGTGVPCVYEYDAAGRMTREHTRDGGRFDFSYDAEGRCVATTGIDGYDRQRLSYFSDAHVTQVEDGLGRTRLFEWRSDGQVERVTSPLGNVECYGYDALGRVTSFVDGAKRETVTRYDARGDRCRVEHPDGTFETYTFDARRLLVEQRDRAGAVWRWEYDDVGRLVAEVDPLGGRQERRYDARGYFVGAVDPTGRVRAYVWNDEGDLAEVHQPDGGVVRFAYDIAGHVIEDTDEAGATTRLVREARGLVVRCERADGCWRYAYDVAGNVHEMVSPEGRRTTYRYGPCRRLLRVEQADGTALRLEWAQVPGQVVAIYNEAGEAWRFAYDADGRLEREVDLRGFGRRYERDGAGRVLRTVGDDGSVVRFGYDEAGRVVAQDLPDGTRREFAYDGEGRLLRASCPDITVTFERDALGRVLREAQGDFVVESRYDGAGRRLGYRAGDALDVRFERDAVGRLRAVDVVRGGRAAWWASFERDVAGRPVAQRMPGGVRTEWRYRADGLVDTRRVRHGAELVGEVGYAWGVDGVVAAMHDRAWGERWFEHDARGHAVKEQRSDGVTRHRAVDAAGNFYENPSRTDRRYGEGGVLLETAEVCYAYADSGERVAREHRHGGRWRYEWSALKELVAVQRPDGARVVFRYDALGRRIEKRSGDEVTRYRWDGDDLIAACPGDGEAVWWVFGDESYAPLARVDAQHSHSVVSDHLGAPTALYDEFGALAWRMQLDLYGAARIEGDVALCPWRWPGQWADEETGLRYNRHRYYDPESGAYLSPDPIGLLGGLRAYGYAPDPLIAADPLGLTPIQWVDSNSVSYTQRSINRNAETYRGDMGRVGGWDWDRSGPLRVMNVNGQLVSYDNRRLWAAQMTRNVNPKVPVIVVDPNGPSDVRGLTWAQAFKQRREDSRNKVPVPEQGVKTKPRFHDQCR